MWSNISGADAGTWALEAEWQDMPDFSTLTAAAADDGPGGPGMPLSLGTWSDASAASGQRSPAVDRPRAVPLSTPTRCQSASPRPISASLTDPPVPVNPPSPESRVTTPGPRSPVHPSGRPAAVERSLLATQAVHHVEPPKRPLAPGFPLRDPDDPARAHPQFANQDGGVSSWVQEHRAVLRPPTVAFLRRVAGLSADEMAGLVPMLQTDVMAELSRLIRGRAVLPRYDVRPLQSHELPPHEQGMVGLRSLFALAQPEPSLRYTLRNGRILGLYLTTSRELGPGQGAALSADPCGAGSVLELLKRGGWLVGLCGAGTWNGTGSADGGRGGSAVLAASSRVVPAQTAARSGALPRLDEARLNAVLAPFDVRMTDAQGRDCEVIVMALLGLDGLYDLSQPTLEIRVNYGDAGLRVFESMAERERTGEIGAIGYGLADGSMATSSTAPPGWTPCRRPIPPLMAVKSAPPKRGPSAEAGSSGLGLVSTSTEADADASSVPVRKPSRRPKHTMSSMPPLAESNDPSIPVKRARRHRRSYVANDGLANVLPATLPPRVATDPRKLGMSMDLADWQPLSLDAIDRLNPGELTAPSLDDLLALMARYPLPGVAVRISKLLAWAPELWIRGWRLRIEDVHALDNCARFSSVVLDHLCKLASLSLSPTVLSLMYQRPRRDEERDSMYLQRLQFCGRLPAEDFKELLTYSRSFAMPAYVDNLPVIDAPLPSGASIPAVDSGVTAVTGATAETGMDAASHACSRGPTRAAHGDSAGESPGRLATSDELIQLDDATLPFRSLLRAMKLCLAAKRAGVRVAPPQLCTQIDICVEDAARVVWVFTERPMVAEFLDRYPRERRESLAAYAQRVKGLAVGDRRAFDGLTALFAQIPGCRPRGRAAAAGPKPIETSPH